MMQDDAVLDRIGTLVDDLKLANLRAQISTCRCLLHNGDNLDVAVFGRFKSGKSSLLNHIAGRDVLPIGVVPLTAVITRLRYGGMERAEVRFLDGGVREIPIGEVGLYVNEKENPDNKRRVATVDIELPSLERFDPLRFVDTPGLGSAFTHNTAAALEWLPNVGAALVAVSADAPLSERDLALLADLRRHTPTIILLLTKADLLNSAQRIEVRTFVDEQFHRQNGHPPAVYFYTVMPALTELSVKFEQEVLLPMRRNRGEASRQILRHKVDSVVKQALNYTRVAFAAATQVESARTELRNRLAAERQQFELLRAELGGLARQWIANALDDFLVALDPTEQGLEARAAGNSVPSSPTGKCACRISCAFGANGCRNTSFESWPKFPKGGCFVPRTAEEDKRPSGAGATGLSRPAGRPCPGCARSRSPAARSHAHYANAGGTPGRGRIRIRCDVRHRSAIAATCANPPIDRTLAPSQDTL